MYKRLLPGSQEPTVRTIRRIVENIIRDMGKGNLFGSSSSPRFITGGGDDENPVSDVSFTITDGVTSESVGIGDTITFVGATVSVPRTVTVAGGGPTGFRGATGQQGQVGPTGEQGATGDMGATGFKGAAGATGLMGATGSRGGTGLKGGTGFKGVAGATGLSGDVSLRYGTVSFVPTTGVNVDEVAVTISPSYSSTNYQVELTGYADISIPEKSPGLRTFALYGVPSIKAGSKTPSGFTVVMQWMLYVIGPTTPTAPIAQ